MQFQILRGDCLTSMRAMPDNSVDSVVCDPPYELGFMGKAWDASGIANNPVMWAEALRVLKPGGHLLAFSGSRTYHRMTCAIEDAGFDVRDQIMWVYGSGFPKSLDVSKAIDKCNGNPLAFRQFAESYRQAIESWGKTHSDMDRLLGLKSSSCYWARSDHRGGMPPRQHWASVKKILSLGDTFDRLYDEAEREVTGQQIKARSTSGASALPTVGGETIYKTWDVTAPATDAARQWDGWGTALKPAHEPICVARKPLGKGMTVAANVLAFGTGAINIDGCRVGTGSGKPAPEYVPNMGNAVFGKGKGMGMGGGDWNDGKGRWPANLIHDGGDEVVALFPAQAGASAPVRGTEASAASVGRVTGERDRVAGAFHGDSGSAARFFYQAKTSKADRNAGLADPGTQFKHGTTLRQIENTGTAGNTHPTVKPTDLMAYLVRLVTPPGGLVLDPFMGSGSTGKACMREGFRFIGCELSDEYADIAEARISHELMGDLL